MNVVLKSRLRKAWYLLRGRLRPRVLRADRLVVGKARWLNDAASPVVLMIDDLTNAWHSPRGGQWTRGGDWGGGLRQAGSVVSELESGLFRDFPEIHATYFTVAGPISPYTHHQPFSYARPLDADDASREFFRSIADDPRFELAYHGLNHGTPGDSSDRFLQEWRGFGSVDAAVEQTRRGLDIFVRAIGRAPQGGKYGGYASNEHSEAALAANGFRWWCRDWTPRDVSGTVADEFYEPQFFADGRVIAMPTTVHGFFWDTRQIDRLVQKGQVIGIAEHIAPVRPDGRTQTPNIIDDMLEVRGLYRYLRGKDVWHANGSDIAAYFEARERTTVHDVDAHGFSLRYAGNAPTPRLTLKLDATVTNAPDVDVVCPDGRVVRTTRGRDGRQLVNLSVIDGRYQVRPGGA